MSIFSSRKKSKPTPVPLSQQDSLLRPGYPLTQSTSLGSARDAPRSAPPGQTLTEFGQYGPGAGISSRDIQARGGLLPAPSNSLGQRRSARDLASSYADDARDRGARELADPAQQQYMDARFPAEQDLPEVPVTEVGYLAEGRQVTLGLGTVTGLLQVVGKELEAKALTTPLLFSTRALDLSSHRVRSLVRTFLRTVAKPGSPPDPEASRRWQDEVRFSGPHELAAVLRWGLARVVRVVGQTYLRGLLDISLYDDWRAEEISQRYPPSAFLSFPSRLPIQVQPLLAVLFPLLARFAANATYSGLTPAALANVFGPLIFGLGHPSQPFTATYTSYLAASHATEHLILAFIRLQDHELQQKSGVSLPTRLKDWVRGYPSMLPSPSAQPKDQPRKNAKLVRVISVRRNVRLYSPNLIQTASTWSAETLPDQPIHEWTRITGPGKTAQPLYTEEYRKKLDLPLTALPTSPYLRVPPIPPPKDRVDGPTVLGTIVIPEADKFKSLTDLRWGMFETSGFDLPDPKKLEFDLTESARKRQPSKRDTIAWSDFANTGFTREDLLLDFSPPVQESISTWPDHQAELHRKLRKQQKALPAFAWDTHPVHGRDKLVDEAFIDCWADLLLSTGWMEREEQTYRECNWAMVEYRAAPEQQSTDQRPPSTLTAYGSDNRISSQWYVFEEFVPREYRDTLLNPKKKKGGLFSTVKSKKLIPIITNGRPQAFANAPRSPAREAEFERLIAATERGDNRDDTRKMSLKGAPQPPDKPRLQISTPLQPGEHPPGKLRKPPFPLHPSSSVGPLNRLKQLGRHSPATPSEETEVDVEFGRASLSDHEDEGEDGRGGAGGKRGPQRPQEQWVDVRLADRNKAQPHLPASPVSQHAPRTPPRAPGPTAGAGASLPPATRATTTTTQPTGDPSQFTRHELPTPEAPSPGSEFPVPEEYESEGVTPIRTQDFPLPPDRSQNRRGIIFPTAGPSPPESEYEEEEEQGDFEPYPEGTEETDSRHGEDEDDEGEDDADAATDMSGPDNATPFDPHGPGGIPVGGWQGRSAGKTASGVSSLIELYQERDRRATLEPATSRIPVRTTSPSITAQASTPAAAAAVTPATSLTPPPAVGTPPRTTSPATASPKGMQSSEGSALFEPEKIQTSFPRYVHGAPLHNLLEAPEEEEEDE